MADFVLHNAHRGRVTLNTLGAAITSAIVPDARGNPGEVTVPAGGSAGKTIGRYANRIAGAEFQLDGQTYALPANEGRNTLHGGPDGWSKRDWSREGEALVLRSPDGDQGFPGAVECRVRYTWGDDGALRIDYTATADAPTVINLTNHVYFNLNGEGEIGNHELQIHGSSYTPLDAELIPTGEIAPVDGTSRDFRAMRPIGSEKYDVCFAIDGWNGELRRVAELRDTRAGRRIIVETTQPGLQLYTGKPGAVALETQHFADSPHHSNFPSTELRPDRPFAATTIYRFEALS
ncbi:MAG TPA: aldose epimerase family protein [Candidatus Baltobacteraceae bacterium]|nr:aldose epimerase family protein [Candidatus Baltobacteraceae bacterium]